MKRKYLGWILCMSITGSVMAQEKVSIDSAYNNSHYRERMELFEKMPATRKGIVFLGNSITEAGKWNDLLPGRKVMNRGISGDNSFGVVARMSSILKNKPSKIFLMIGINDLKREVPVPVIAENYKRIIQAVKTSSPGTKLYLQSVLPVNDSLLIAPFRKIKNEDILKLNQQLQSMADGKNIFYVDLHKVFSEANGQLKADETPDGIHLKISSYAAWVDYLKKLKCL
jgi:lysophospholipase L1-like esterase